VPSFKLVHKIPSRVIEVDLFTTLAFDMKNGTSGERDMHHFFKAEGLYAELSFIVIPATFLALFEFDWAWDDGTIGTVMQLDQVRFPDQAKGIGNEPHPVISRSFSRFRLRGTSTRLWDSKYSVVN
jgi:hypothetical protein